MAGLRVVPTFRHGQERYYVLGADGRSLGWYDREAGRVNLLREEGRDGVLTALGPYLVGPVTVGPPPVPTPAELAGLALHPDDDLAPNRPGEALHIALDRDLAAPRLLRGDPRRRALAAEQAVGQALEGLELAGWRVLHSVPLPGGARIHHLLIGPGGLFCVRSLDARRKRVRVAGPHVAVGRGAPDPLLRRLGQDAERASLALAAQVRPALAVVEPAGLQVASPLGEARVLPAAELPSLAGVGGILKPADIEALYAQARDRHTWLRV